MVGLIVVLGALLSWRHTRNAHEWLIMTDELQYLKLADSVGLGSFPRPTLRGEHIELLSLLYPLLISPVVALLSAPEGYQLVHAVNAVLFASTAIPVYLLTRQVVATRWPAYLAAALAVAVPWASLSAVVMTESAGYPAFAWALLAIQRALVAPSLGRDAVALAAIALAFFARTQFVFLAGVFPAAVVVHAVLFTLAGGAGDAGRSRPRQVLDALRPHAALGGLVALGLVLLLLPGEPLKSLLGPFQNTVLEGGRLPDGLWAAARTHIVYVAGGVGFLPFALAAGWALAGLVRPANRASHAFAVLALLAGGGAALRRHGLRPAARRGPAGSLRLLPRPAAHRRHGGLPGAGASPPARPCRSAPCCRSGCCAAPVSASSTRRPLRRLAGGGVSPRLAGQADRLATFTGIGGLSPLALISWGTLAATTAVALLLWRAPRYALAIVGLPLLGLALAQTDYVAKRFTMHVNTASPPINAGTLADRDWVDAALPGPGDVAISPSTVADPGASRLAWWNVEFWNKRVNRALIVAGFGDHTPFPSQSMTLDARDGSIATSDGGQPRYIVFGRNQNLFRPQGRLLAEYRTTQQQDPGLELFDVQRPYRAGWIAEGASTDGWIVRGTPLVVRVFPRADGRAQRVTVNVDLPVGDVAASPFSLREGRRVVRGEAAPATINGDAHVSLCVAPGRLRRVSLSTRAVRPLPDGRRIGVHLHSIRVEPAAAGC